MLDQPCKKRIGVASSAGAIAGVVFTILALYLLAQDLGKPLGSDEHTLISFAVAFSCGAFLPTAVRVLRSLASGPSGGSRLGARPSGGTLEPVHDDDKHAEQRLLEAIERHGGISPAKAAIEAGLSVEEADGILSGLAQKGFLEVRVEEGKLIYGM